MYAGRDFDVAQSSESLVYGFNFINDLSSGDSIVSASFTLTVAEGTDPSPASHLVNTPWIQSAYIANQRIYGLLTGVRYILSCTCNTAKGDVVTLYSHINSVAPD